MNRILLFFIIYFAIAFFPGQAAGQFFPTTAADSTEIRQADSERDPLGRDTPRGTVGGFFKALSNDDYSRASKFVDFSNYSESRNDSAVTAMILKMEKLLDRYGTSTPLSVLSSKAEGNLEDGLASELDELGTLRMKDKREVMYLERIPSEDGALWLISSQTTDMLIQYISANEEEYSLDDTIDGFWQSRWKGAAIKDWTLTIVLGIGSYLLAWVLTFFLRWIILSVWKSLRYNKYGEFLQTLLIPLRLVITAAILTPSVRALEISIVVRQALGPVYLIILLTALFIFIWLLINSLSSYGEQRLRERGSYGGLSAISFFRNSAKFGLVIIAILIAFDTIGWNITAGLAALGVGGFALALGAQKTVENLVGGLSVVFDQPVSVGDFCKFGDTIGTVEKIGMRSTRIRTLNRTLVSIPNANFSSLSIENYASRDLFLYQTTIGLRYETTSDQMRYILIELRKILYAHPKVDPDPARVRFLGYASDSLQVELFAYTYAKNWNDFLAIQEDINLRMAEVIEESGSGFAFPSQTVYLSKDKGLSQTKRDNAEAKVKEWVENNELELPEFDTEDIKRMKGSLSYPPEGSKNASSDP